MTREEFEQLVTEEFPNAIPENFQGKIRNVAFLVEEEPSLELRALEGLAPHETLLGHYRGIPATSRGTTYGVGATLPDTITLFKIPIEHEALELLKEGAAAEPREALRLAIRETIWHEVAHHFGMDEPEVRSRENKRRAAP